MSDPGDAKIPGTTTKAGQYLEKSATYTWTTKKTNGARALLVQEVSGSEALDRRR